MREETALGALYGGLGVASVVGLGFGPRPAGWTVAALVGGFLAAAFVLSARRELRHWRPALHFSVLMSLVMVIPDWILSDVLGVLVFPDDGFPKIGAVSGYMAGMWAIPLFLVIRLGERAAERSMTRGVVVSALTALVLFVGSEAVLWRVPIWYAQNVTMVGHVAVYVIVPEMVLGISTWLAFRTVRDGPLVARWVAPVLVMQLYAGGVVLFWFLIDFVSYPS